MTSVLTATPAVIAGRAGCGGVDLGGLAGRPRPVHARGMRKKLTFCCAILVAVAIAAFVAAIVYVYASVLVDIFGPVGAALVFLGWVVVSRIADFVAPRSDGASWF